MTFARPSGRPRSSASGACLTARRTGIPPTRVEGYVRAKGDWHGRGRFAARTGYMVRDRLHHDIEVAERATGAFAFGVVIAAFIAVAAGTAIYNIGKWLALW